MRLIDADKLNETFGNSLFFDEDNQCRINEIIDNAPTVEAVQLDFHEKCMDMTVKEMLEKPTESEIVKAYTKGFDTGVETARTKGEYIEEDILQIIKENFDIGYEMAKNRYERPKGEWQPLGIATPDIRCSKCGCIVAFNYHKTPFCPGCGADMRGGKITVYKIPVEKVAKGQPLSNSDEISKAMEKAKEKRGDNK